MRSVIRNHTTKQHPLMIFKNTTKQNPTLLICSRFSHLLLLIILLNIKFSHAQGNIRFNLNQISISDGLTSHNVTSILEDQHGVYWVGTRKGLNRIIGKEIQNYYRITSDSTSITDNHIRKLLEDRHKNIWILSNSGLSMYNQHCDNFTPITYDNRDIIAYSFSETEDGILFGSNKYIYKYTHETGALTRIITIDNDDFIIDNIIKIDDDHLLISQYKRGLYIVNTKNSQLKTLLTLDYNISTRGIIMDSSDRLWIPTYKKGVITATIEDYKLTDIKKYNSTNSALGDGTVLHFLELDSKIWVSTDGNGLFIYDKEDDSFSALKTQRNVKKTSLSSTTFLYQNSNNNILAGTVRGGIISIKPSHVSTYYFDKDIDSNHQTITAVYIDETNKDRAWIGSDGSGITIFDYEDNKFTKIPSTNNLKVTSIIKFSKHQLIFSAYDNGLYLLDMHTLKITPYKIVDREVYHNICANQRTISLSRINNNIYIFATTKLCYKLDKDRSFRKVSTTDQNIEEKDILAFHSAEKGTYLIASEDNFIYYLPDNDTEIKTYYKNNKHIHAATVDNNGNTLFFDSDGLKILKEKGTHLLLPLKSIVTAMICDNKNRIWLCTRDNIICYNLNNSTANILDFSDGIKPNEYIDGAVVKDYQGNIYIGGIEGFLRIDKEIIFKKNKAKKASIITIKVSDKKTNLSEIDTTLKLPYNFSSMELIFSSKNGDIFANNELQFTLKGNHIVKLEANDNNNITIHSLTPGEYEINYSYMNKNGIYSMPSKLLLFTVEQPWWNRWWVIVLYIMAGCTIIYWILLTQSRRQKRQIIWAIKNKEQKLSEEKVQFLINISHELRTPLTLTYVPLKALLKENTLEDKDSSKIKKIFSQVQNMIHLIDMVLDTRRLEATNRSLDIKKHDFNRWINDVCDQFSMEFESRNIKFEIELNHNIDEFNFDAGRCKIVLSNLLMNAIKYSPRHTTICVKTELIDSNIKVSVIDQGIGINEANTKKIFDKFYQGKDASLGYGIGLSYSKMLIEMHNGTISGCNNGNGGSTFYFQLPVEQSETFNTSICSINNLIDLTKRQISSLEQEVQLSSQINFSTQNNTILIVDDEVEILELLKEILSPYFKKIYCANDGVRALSIINRKTPDIVVSDVMMPNMDGYELCRKIKTDITISHIPIILLTARTDAQSTLIGYKMGADNYLPKPFDIETLQSIIENELQKRVLIKQRYHDTNSIQTPESITFSNADESFIVKLNQFIDANISNEKLNLDLIATHMGMSRTLFQNKMKLILDTNISHYLNNIRIERAKILLHNMNLSLSSITYELGYSSQSYFTNVFKKQTGLTPLVYRNKLKESVD